MSRFQDPVRQWTKPVSQARALQMRESGWMLSGAPNCTGEEFPGAMTITCLARSIRLVFAAKADPETRKYVGTIAAKYGMKSCDDIRIGKCAAPYICGLIRPVLVLPEQNAQPEEPVILHELLHRKWKDVAVNIGLHVARVVNWFNPVVWFLTCVVQNDSEALCDQRVLECYSEDMEKAYGEMLLAVVRNRKQGHVKAGTSNMAGSYRNMKTRIRRICDFHRVPEGLGLVAFCITLMLAVSGIGVSAREQGYKASVFETEKELRRELWKAQLYHVRTPEEAVCLFLRAAAEQNVFYRISVLPQEHTEAFEAWAEACWREGILDGEGVFDASGGQKGEEGEQEDTGRRRRSERYAEGMVYFPGGISKVLWLSHRVYNLQWEEGQGTATVFVRFRSGEGGGYGQWKLQLTEEDGWKVWLAEDAGRAEGEYQEPSLFSGKTQMGDFVLEASAYNEGYFDSLTVPSEEGMKRYDMATDAQGTEKMETFQDSFSVEYKMIEYAVTYVGQESLEGCSVRVEIAEDGKELPAEGTLPDEKTLRILSGNTDEAEEVPDQETESAAYSGYVDGYFIAGFDGSVLAEGMPYSLGGGGEGVGSGRGWKNREEICVHVRIYVDGSLVEEERLKL